MISTKFYIITLLIGYCVFIESSAESKTWTTSEKSMSTSLSGISSWECRHELTDIVQEEKVGDEERIDSEKECRDDNVQCVNVHTYNTAKSVTHSVGVGLAGSLSLMFEALGEVMGAVNVEYTASFGTELSNGGSMECTVEPGWKSWITSKPKFIRIKGHLTKRCHYRENGWIAARDTVDSGPSQTDIPRKRKNGDLDAIISCRSSPIADMSNDVTHWNLEKITRENDFEAVERAVKKVISTVRSRVTVKTSFEKGGTTVWAEGKCLNNIDVYVCKACLRKLNDRLMVTCNNGRGCRREVKDCQLRYEFYDF